MTCLFLLNSRENVSSRLLSTGRVVYVGKISYSLYLYKAFHLEYEVEVLYPPSFLPILKSRLSNQTCIVDDKMPMTPQTFQQCTISPEPDSGIPTIWALGDSHVAHLQGLLYKLNNRRD